MKAKALEVRIRIEDRFLMVAIDNKVVYHRANVDLEHAADAAEAVGDEVERVISDLMVTAES